MHRVRQQRNRSAGRSKGQRQALSHHLSSAKHTGQHGGRHNGPADTEQPARGARQGAQRAIPGPTVAGPTGGLFGVGGAVGAAPVLTSVVGTTQVGAPGLSLALAAPSTAVTLLTYAVHDEVNWVMGVPMAIGGLLSISWGVRLAHALPERMLRGLYCAFLLLCAGLLAIKA